MVVYVVLDLLDHERLIGIWSSEEKARGWLRGEVERGSWTEEEADSVSIEAWEVDEVL